MIQITTKREGFRRLGIAHSEKTTSYQDDHFTAEQLAILKADPMLIVVEGAKDVKNDNEQLEQLIAANADLTAQLEAKDHALAELEKQPANAALAAKLEEKDQEIAALKQQVAAAASSSAPTTTSNKKK